MATNYNPRTVTDGLVLALDAGNIKGYDKYENLFTYSIFEQGLFVRNSGTFTANATVAPDGTSTASLVTPSSSSSYYGWLPNSTYTFTNGIAILSFYAKANGYNWVGVKSALGTSWSYSAAGYNLSTGETFTYDLDTNGYQFVSANSVGNGWYRIVIRIRANSLSSGSYMNIGVWSDMPTQHIGVWNGNGTSGAYFWGAQLENGSTANDYYPTTGTAKTRGTILTDLSGFGNTGTITTGPTYSSANGGSLDFDGVDDYGYINYSPSLAPTSAISGGGWVFYSDWINSSGNIFSKLQSGGYGLQHSIIGGNVSFLVRLSGAFQSSTFSKSLMNSGWNHIFGTFDGRYIRMYLNGNAVGTPYDHGSVTSIEYSVSNNLGLCIDAGSGSSNSVEGTPTNARISSIQIYNKALTAAEVRQNYNATKGRFGL
jgi:hypothetical protein